MFTVTKDTIERPLKERDKGKCDNSVKRNTFGGQQSNYASKGLSKRHVCGLLCVIYYRRIGWTGHYAARLGAGLLWVCDSQF